MTLGYNGDVRRDGERDSGFWSGFGTGCAGEFGTWALFAIGSGIAGVAGLRWGWGIAAGAMLVVGAVLWMNRKRSR